MVSKPRASKAARTNTDKPAVMSNEERALRKRLPELHEAVRRNDEFIIKDLMSWGVDPRWDYGSFMPERIYRCALEQAELEAPQSVVALLKLFPQHRLSEQFYVAALQGNLDELKRIAPHLDPTVHSGLGFNALAFALFAVTEELTIEVVQTLLALGAGDAWDTWFANEERDRDLDDYIGDLIDCGRGDLADLILAKMEEDQERSWGYGREKVRRYRRRRLERELAAVPDPMPAAHRAMHAAIERDEAEAVELLLRYIDPEAPYMAGPGSSNQQTPRAHAEAVRAWECQEIIPEVEFFREQYSRAVELFECLDDGRYDEILEIALRLDPGVHFSGGDNALSCALMRVADSGPPEAMRALQEGGGRAAWKKHRPDGESWERVPQMLVERCVASGNLAVAELLVAIDEDSACYEEMVAELRRQRMAADTEPAQNTNNKLGGGGRI
jgi:hypothetical protein